MTEPEYDLVSDPWFDASPPPEDAPPSGYEELVALMNEATSQPGAQGEHVPAQSTGQQAPNQPQPGQTKFSQAQHTGDVDDFLGAASGGNRRPEVTAASPFDRRHAPEIGRASRRERDYGAMGVELSHQKGDLLE